MKGKYTGTLTYNTRLVEVEGDCCNLCNCPASKCEDGGGAMLKPPVVTVDNWLLLLELSADMGS